MSNVVHLLVDREPCSTTEWREALAAAEQRCADARLRINAQGEIIRRSNMRAGLLEAERDAAVGEARCADIQRRLMASQLEAMRWSVPIMATGLGILLGALVTLAGMWAVMA